MTDWPLPSAFEPPADPRALLDWLDEQEQRIADVVADVTTRVVRDAYADYLATLEPDVEPGAVTAAGDLNALDSIPQRWSIAATGRILPELNGMFVAGGIAAWTQSGATAIDGSAWANVVNQQAVGYIATASNRLAGVGNNLWWGVRSMTRKAIEAGATNEDLKRNIEALTKFSEFRADTIARTETVGAFNNGEYAGNLALGDQGPVEKWWLATRDARSREAHVAAQPVEMGGRGKVIPYSATFEVGGVDMLHPHAPGAPAAQVVNCRCVLITLYPGDERPDGTIVPERTPSPNPPPTPPPAPPPPAKKAARPRRPATRIPRQGFATADEAVAHLRREHPQIVWGDGLLQSDPEMITDIARSAERLAARHPKYWQQVRVLGTESAEEIAEAQSKVQGIGQLKGWDWGDNVNAHAWTSIAYQEGVGVIGWNPAKLRNRAGFMGSKKIGIETKWAVTKDAVGTNDHEFGHLYRYLRLREARDRDGGGIKTFGYIGPDSVGTLSKVESDLLEGARQRIAKWGSEYGAKNTEEAFAECFAAREYLAAGGKPTAGLRRMAAIMDAFDEFVDTAKATFGHSPADRLAMLETIEGVYRKHGIDFRPDGWEDRLAAAREAVEELG